MNDENNINVFVVSPSFYSLMQGENPLSDKLMAILNINKSDVPRYRDVFLNEDGSRIAIRTRTGGGNRDTYEEENDALCKHPLYLFDEDDDFDCTYAYFYFKMPDELKEWGKANSTGEAPPNMWDITQRAIEAMKGVKNNQP